MRIFLVVFLFLILSIEYAQVGFSEQEYLPPLKQFKLGILIDEIQCRESLILVIKNDGSPACVKLETKHTLIERGWTIDHEIPSLEITEVNPENNVVEIVESNNQFALNFYSQINNNSENIFFSPWSISTAFAIVSEGAKGDTAEQINDVFGFSNDPQQRQNEFKLANDNLNHPDKDYSLSVANALWLAMDFTAKPEYVDAAKTYYDSNVESVDFRTDGIGVINSWVENKTQNKIKELFEPGSLDDAVFAITNAIYFKGTWVNQFDPDRTKVRDFWVTEESPVSIPMMFMPESKQKVAFLEQVHMIEIPYEGDKISMLVLLPGQRHELDRLESVLDGEKISQWRQGLQEKSMAVTMPKFKLETDYKLIPHLRELGISDAFGGNADFGTMSDSNLFIGEAVHKAFVDVNEEGTEAAAATGVGGFQSGPPTFEIDQPFIFIIQDTESGRFLFVGRMVDPS